MEEIKIFGGLSQIEMEIDEFHLGDGIIIRKTYAHLFAPFMMAFSPPGNGKLKFHGGPWKTTKGGISFDILVEIEMPKQVEFEKAIDSEELIWLIACLIRLGSHPFVLVSAISDMSFNNIKTDEAQPTITPIETKKRIFSAIEDRKPILSIDDLEWLKLHWKIAAKLIINNPKFYPALKSFDDATIQGKKSSALLNIWGAIEHLFSPNTGELKYRVSSNLAAFLAKHGEKRLEIFKELSKLYNERSTAAHTSKDVETAAIISSYVHFRNALVKIIEDGKIPSQEELESLIFKAEE